MCWVVYDFVVCGVYIGCCYDVFGECFGVFDVSCVFIGFEIYDVGCVYGVGYFEY